MSVDTDSRLADRGEGLARGRRVIRRLRSGAGRVYYALSSQLDARPEELLPATLSDAERRGRTPICVAASFALGATEIERLAREPTVNAIVSKTDPAEIGALRRQVPTANLGAYWEPGRWMLPPGIVHVYFIGSWRLLTLAILRETIRQNAVSLSVRCGRSWIDVPIGAIRRAAGYRRRLLWFWGRLPLSRIAIPAGYGLPARLVSSSVWPGVLAAQPGPAAQPLGDPAAAAASPLRIAAKGRTAADVEVAPVLSAGMLRKLVERANLEQPRDCVPGRIVLACGSLQPGGAERQVAYTAAGLATRAGVESVALICDLLTQNHPERYDFYLPLLQKSGVPVDLPERYAGETSMIDEPGALTAVRASFHEGLLLDIANLYKEFRRRRPEVVHAWLDWSNTRAGFAAALAGVPRIVLSGRNLAPTNFALYQPYMDPIYQALCSLPNVVMLNNSRAGADSYAEWLGILPNRVRVVHNAFDVNSGRGEDRAAIRVRLGIPPRVPVIGGVFRFYPEKRPLLWMEVAGRIARTHPDAWFVLVGQGILRREIEDSARRLGIAERLVLPGVVSDVLPIMQVFDAFLLTSYGEGLPNVVLEAQWTGTPVIATEAGGVAEAVEPGVTGWIVDTPDAEGLADRVAWLLNSPEAISRARVEGPALIRRRFGMQRMIDETMEAYGLAQPGSATLSAKSTAVL